MGIRDWLKQQADRRAHRSEQAVLVHFKYGSTDLSTLVALENALTLVIARAKAGEMDSNAIAADGSTGTLFMYGPSADRLFSVIRPTLETAPFLRGARVLLRYGPPEDGVEERALTLAD